MGVPSFYRWLVEKYPLIVVNVIEEEPIEIDGVSIPVDTSKTNPNKIEFDNLYLDMNGIIHPCFHPENRSPPVTFNEVFRLMFDYIDKLFVMVRPRKLLYMAIDGTAPRAKMNQQRARRFRSAKDAADFAAEEERLRLEFEKEGRKLPLKQKSQVYDSNVITPGTEFMAILSTALQYYIHLRLNYDPGWKSIKVILSDANDPGEGEHKIMSYIRLQRNLPGYDPNTRHCLYGQDADLIMLSLATHEVHFSILREIVFTHGQVCKCLLCGQLGHSATNCEAKAWRSFREFNAKCKNDVALKIHYQFLNIWTLRKYLEYEMTIPNPPVKIDIERIVDDFVFMCCFVGNDFLPHMPTLEIREDGINLMIDVYKKEFRAMGGYMTSASQLDLRRVVHFSQAVGSFENKIFQKRARLRQRQVTRIRREKMQGKWGDEVDPEETLEPFVPVAEFRRSHSQLASAHKHTESRFSSRNSTYISKNRGQSINDLSIRSWFKQTEGPDAQEIHIQAQKQTWFATDGGTNSASIVEDENRLDIELQKNEEELKTKLKELLRKKADLFNSNNPEGDKVRLGDPGWKKRYYEEKFSAKTTEEYEKILKDVVFKYTEGLCWVMQYYYEGVCSWKWFYPYHYAPFASDLIDLKRFKINFELGSPFKPFDQLMGVFPATSGHAVPLHYRKLMTDPNSPIIDFYPSDFEVDMDGKRYAWQGIAKLPFIDEQRLLAEVEKVEHTLTEEELRRNSVMSSMLFVSLSHPLSPYIVTLSDQCKHLPNDKRAEVKEKIDPGASGGMNGYLLPCNGDPCPPIFRSPCAEMEDIVNNQVICVIYRLPDAHKHITYAPPGVIFPEETVTMGDLKPVDTLWHEEDDGRKPWENARQNPPETISNRELGDAAQRLVVNSLQLKTGSFSSGGYRGKDGDHRATPPHDRSGQRQYLRSTYAHYEKNQHWRDQVRAPVSHRHPTTDFSPNYQPSYSSRPIPNNQPSYPSRPIPNNQPSYPSRPIPNNRPSYPSRPIPHNRPSYPSRLIPNNRPSYPSRPIYTPKSDTGVSAGQPSSGVSAGQPSSGVSHGGHRHSEVRVNEPWVQQQYEHGVRMDCSGNTNNPQQFPYRPTVSDRTGRGSRPQQPGAGVKQ